MRTSSKLAALGITSALAIAPGASIAAGSHGRPATKPQPPTTHHAFGKYCQGESKVHVKAEKGTPFSRCVTDMAKLAGHKTRDPRTACKDESTTHVKGEKGTPFSRCVVAGDRLLKATRSA
jgi:hypothetical protein